MIHINLVKVYLNEKHYPCECVTLIISRLQLSLIHFGELRIRRYLYIAGCIMRIPMALDDERCNLYWPRTDSWRWIIAVRAQISDDLRLDTNGKCIRARAGL